MANDENPDHEPHPDEASGALDDTSVEEAAGGVGVQSIVPLPPLPPFPPLPG